MQPTEASLGYSKRLQTFPHGTACAAFFLITIPDVFAVKGFLLRRAVLFVCLAFASKEQ